MKKITLVLLLILTSPYFLKSQLVNYFEAPAFTGTNNTQAPNGLSSGSYLRGSSLIIASELLNIASNSTITSFGFTVNSGTSNIPVSGNFTIYLQNTSDVNYNKGTVWSSIITGMSQVYSNTLTLPVSSGATSITVNLSTPFVYTGGGLYVAYDWASTGPFSSTFVTYRGNTNLLSSSVFGGSNSIAQTTLSYSNFRPSFLLGITNTYTNECQVVGIEAPGKVPAMLNSPHFIRALVKNASNQPLSTTVSLNVTGVNTFANTQTITNLAAGATATVNFAAFNPILPGLNTLSVSIPPDQNNANNSAAFAQSVTCNEWSINPANATFTSGAIGFNNGSGIAAVTYSNPVSTTLSAIRIAISNSNFNTGNSVWGVVLNAAGSVIATSNTILLNSSNQASSVNFSFTPALNLLGGATYYLGVAQPTSTGFFPLGSYTTTAYVPYSSYITTSINGGTLTPSSINLGYFGIEAILTPNTATLSVTSFTAYCGFNSVLTASCSGNYTWTNGPTNTNFSVNPTVTTTYTVSSSSTLGCVVSQVATISVIPVTVSLTSSAYSVCAGKTLTLSASGTPFYSWNNGLSTTVATITVAPSTSTNYLVVGNNGAGCTSTANVSVTVFSFSTMTVSSPTLSTCLGNSLSIGVSGAISYTFNNGQVPIVTANNGFTFIPNANVIYTITGINAQGCLNAQTVTVSVNSFSPAITGLNALCIGQQSMLNVLTAGANSFTWNTGSNFSGISISPTVTTGYTVNATGTNGCVGKASITVSVNPNPTVIVSADRLTMCYGESNVLSASGANNYTWTGGITGATVALTPTVNLNSIVSVIGANSFGCSDSKTLTIIVDACTGISELSALNSQLVSFNSQLRVYPNPTSGSLNVRIENAENITAIKVLNATGEIIEELKNPEASASLNLEKYCDGFYFVAFMNKDKTIHLNKLIKASE